MAWWPGTIEPDQDPIDFIHVVDLYTTAARLGGAFRQIPGDRVTDGVDQTALLLNGDTHGRRDYVFVYEGPTLRSIVKQQYDARRSLSCGRPMLSESPGPMM